ncbi:MAG: cobalt-precorrin 5A hydrolase [Salinivirgaceae bacterium]|jgi:cobalt-precorrin 5A hydrolase|nr:cobalt-precorrin 5A hydrolase [Salinivirgaceae bacterium]
MIGIISLSRQGNALAAKISGLVGNATCYTLSKWDLQGFSVIKGKLKEFCGEAFQKHDALIFIMASGIVVRSIAPWLKNKVSDPAVVVIDDKGRNVISLLSGHLGGANELSLKIAELISANPVITTASDVNNLPSVDMMAQSKGLLIDSMEDAKNITAMIVNRENVELVDDFEIFSTSFMPIPDGQSKGKVIITNRLNIQDDVPFVKLIPKNIILGIGCKKNTDAQKLFEFIQATIKRFNIDSRSIKSIASISIKENEEAILKAAEELNCSLRFFNAETLQKVDNLFEGSAFVQSTVGVASVSTTSAYLAGKESGSFIVKKEISEGMTLSIFEQKI